MNEDDKLRLDYEQTTRYFYHLSDIRFKLLGLLPLVTGIAASTIPQMSHATPGFAIAMLGLVVTLGITIYDQRNTQIYDRLVKRARFLEEKLGLPAHRITRKSLGGAFQDRPGRRFFVLWHDLGLSLVYSASLAAWTYLVRLEWDPIKTGAVHHEALVFARIVFLIAIAVLLLLAWSNDREEYLSESELSEAEGKPRAGGGESTPPNPGI